MAKSSTDCRYTLSINSDNSKIKGLDKVDLSLAEFTEFFEDKGKTCAVTFTDVKLCDGENVPLELPVEVLQCLLHTECLLQLDLTGTHLHKALESDLLYGNLPLLTTLVLDDTCIRMLHPSIGRLQNLTSLSVKYNRLFDLPLTIRVLSKLKHLDITGNLLRALPGALYHVKNLVKIEGLNENLLELMPEWTNGNSKIYVTRPLWRAPKREEVERLEDVALHYAIGINCWHIPFPEHFREALCDRAIKYDLCEHCSTPVRRLMPNQETNGFTVRVCLVAFCGVRNVPFRFVACSNCKDQVLAKFIELQKVLQSDQSLAELPQVKLKERHCRPNTIRKPQEDLSTKPSSDPPKSNCCIS